MRSRLLAGIVAGLIGGTIYGLMLHATHVSTPFGGMKVIEFIGCMAGQVSALTGWIIHMLISAFLGAIFGLILGRRDKGTGSAVGLGIAFGAAAWLLGYMIIFPLILGLPVFALLIYEGMRTAALVGLFGHLIFGVVTGESFLGLYRPGALDRAASAGGVAVILVSAFCGWPQPSLAEAVPAPAVRPTARPAVVSLNTRVKEWFSRYERIRRDAQMTPAEKSKSQKLLSLSLDPSTSQKDKEEARSLLSKQVSRYSRALHEMRSLPALNETKQLSEGYLRYFKTAGLLFSDLKKVLDNPLAANGGKPVLLGLRDRKTSLEELDAKNKELDRKLRSKYKIPAYPYR